MYHLTLLTGSPAFLNPTSLPYARGVAVVDFRTLPNGAYKYMSGRVRGYWRVLELREVDGPRNINSHNVISVLYSGPTGINGVTSRSRYCLDSSHAKALGVASKWNEVAS